MSASEQVAAPPAPAGMSVFERYLTLWVALCIVVGITLGQLFPTPVRAIGAMELAKVNLPVGLLIWVMIIPMLLRIDFAALGQVRQHAQLAGGQQPVRHGHPQHRRMRLDIKPVAQPQRLELIFTELAGPKAAGLVAKLRDALGNQGLIDGVVSVHGATLGVKRPCKPWLGTHFDLPGRYKRIEQVHCPANRWSAVPVQYR